MAATLPTRSTSEPHPLFGRSLFRSLREEMDDLLSRFSTSMNGEWPGALLAPSLDLAETDNQLQIHMDLPGIKPDNVDIQISGNTVRISGKRQEEKEEKGKTWHRVERRSGSFSRMVTLPCAVREDEAQAEYADGVLTVTLPKAEPSHTKHIKVEDGRRKPR